MPTPRKTTPVKKAAPRKRTPAVERNDPTTAPTSMAAKRAQMRGGDREALDPYAPTVWGSEESSGALVDLELPSGQLCLAQRPGPEGLMTAGLLDDLDMISTVLPKIMGGKGKSGKAATPNLSHMVKNSAALGEMIKLVDRVAVFVVVKPVITPEPEDPADRERGKIYPSSIDLNDKMFLFNWAVGGTRDLATFRGELAESVASMESGEDVEDTSE